MEQILPEENIEVVATHVVNGERVHVIAVCHGASADVDHYEVHAGGVWLNPDEPFFAEPTLAEVTAILDAS